MDRICLSDDSTKSMSKFRLAQCWVHRMENAIHKVASSAPAVQAESVASEPVALEMRPTASPSHQYAIALIPFPHIGLQMLGSQNTHTSKEPIWHWLIGGIELDQAIRVETHVRGRIRQPHRAAGRHVDIMQNGNDHHLAIFFLQYPLKRDYLPAELPAI
jgi:hypothetical protein